MAIAKSRSQEQGTRQIKPELEALLDASIDGVVVVGHDGCIRFMNHAAERMFGYRESEIASQPVSILAVPQRRALLSRYVRRCLRAPRGSTAAAHELMAQRRDGSSFSAEIALGQLRTVKQSQLIAFVRDISQRRRNEEALRHSEAALHTAQELANIGNYVIHFDGEGNDYASPQLQRIFGWEPEESITDIAEYVQSVVHPSDRHRVVQAFTELYAGGGSFDIEYRILHNNTGTRYLHHIAQTIYNNDGRMLQQMGTVHDITERRLAEYEVRQAQERLAHFGRISTMGEMAAAIAHEVNQPLAAIATFAQSCERLVDREDFSREELAASLGQIARQALRTGEIIRRLRSFSKRREVQFEPLRANRLLEESLILAQADAHHHNVRIHVRSAKETPPLRGDALQLQQVLLNLVRNGIEAMIDTPETAREIALRTRVNDQGDVEFTVADRGRGLDPQCLDDLFKPFYTTKATGTGLGLAISATIVRAHGGKLWCDDNPGGGARFIFSLPAASSEAD